MTTLDVTPIPHLVIRPLFTAYCLFFLFLPAFVHAQQNPEFKGKTFTAAEVYLLLDRHKNAEEIKFTDCIINYSEQDDDLRFALDDYRDSERASGYKDQVPKPKIVAEIVFDNCKFNPTINQPVQFSNLYFRGRITMDNCQGYGINFERCVLWDGMINYDVDFRYLTFDNCQFYHSVTFNDVSITQVKAERCHFVRNENSIALGFDFTNRNNFYDILINGCEFLDQSDLARKSSTPDSILHESNLLYFSHFDAEHFHIEESVFDCSLIWEDFSVKTSFVLRNNKYRNKVVFSQAPNIPVEGSVILFSDLLTEDSLKTRIGIIKELSDDRYRFYRYDNDREYAKDQVRPWVDVSPEKQIIPVYSKLLAVYNATSDAESYNLCFRQMKKIEKTASKIRWETRGNFIDWFRWKMDIFLEKFSAYGTDPVLSLFNSFYVICIFAFIYMIFPSEEDNLRFHNIQKAMQKYVDHFAEQQKHFFSADELYQKEKKDWLYFKEQLDENLEKLPPVISFFSGPFYYLTLALLQVRHQVRGVIHFNIYQNWAELTWRGRMKTSTLISLQLIGFLLWGLMMRIINGLTLSLNAFVTLGYGGMEAKGLSRYLCIVEGLIGWFLLSIFSVSLISQILQ